MKKTSLLEELTFTFLLFLSSIDIKHPCLISFLIFFLSGQGVKQLLNKVFNFDYQILANDCPKKEIELSFPDKLCFLIVKTNKAWQQQLLYSKTVSRLETIMLAVTIFWDTNFAFCLKHILNLAIKLRLKIKKLLGYVVNKWKGKI